MRPIFTELDKFKAIERELGYRRRVYPRLIESGKMTRELAAEQIALFEAILNDYRDKAESERRSSDLFAWNEATA